MDRLRNRLLGFGAFVALCAPLTTGCVDNNSTIFIRQLQAPEAENFCVVSNTPDSLHWLEGTMDLSLASSYGGTVLVGNQLQERGDESTARVETGRVQLYEAEIELFDYNGATVSSFTMPTTGFVDVSSGTTPSYGLAGVVLVDQGAGVAANQTYISRVKIYGENLGGIEVETGWWDYPIYVCDGCLGCICPTSAEAEYAPSCRPGQNESVDCRLKPCWDPAAGNYCGCILSG
ncbi:MAG: hypothetical protein JRI23_23365 [Deltaproteobacteria bacterium]|jgi:hypothetical protein|nr:hypothetical protein [Deltaproteobacteria bacterium]MBW2534913.1 hypothetical protein [Deltaproteobacteria bacterium]